MQMLKKVYLLVIFISPIYLLNGQLSSFNPVSSWIFNQSTYNPGYVGSKDFLSVAFIAGSKENSTAQLINANTRLSKKLPGYPGSPDYIDYSSIGVGGQIFNETFGQSHNIGVKASGAYHIKLKENSLSFISFGASLNGIYNILDTTTLGEPESSAGTVNTFDPNLDVGILYYGPNAYFGLSSTNVLGNALFSDSLEIYTPEPRRYHFVGGYKFVVYRPMNIVIEPSVIINITDNTFSDIVDNINPMLKIYIENFCLGTYFYDWDKVSFFFMYNYPKFYVDYSTNIGMDKPVRG